MTASAKLSVIASAPPIERGDGAMIEVTGLNKIYRSREGQHIEALKDVSFDISDGEFVTVVGPSGCGKSTLLKILAGLMPASSGQAKLNGTPIEGPRRDIGMVFQSPVLFPWRSVIDNALLPVDVQRLGREQLLERAHALIALVGLSGFEHRYPWELSGGMQQRVAILRALLHDPSVLLMDEPFGALDAMTRERMNLELQRIWLTSKKTVLLITHSIPEAIFLSDRVFVMSERPGQIAATYDIELPRPRTLDVMGSEQFAAYARTLRAHFFAQGTLDAH
jgi:NitT/TauT family transport system ATP-binding protein